MTNGGASVVTANGGQPPNGNLEKRVAAIEAVLPTLATKADLAELRGEMRSENEKLRAEMRTENEKLRAEMRTENEKLRSEIRTGNEKLRLEFSERYDSLLIELRTSQERLRIETQKLAANLFKWMLATTLTLMIVFAALLRWPK